MVRLLIEEARDALPLPNYPQCERDDRLLISTSTAGALPRSGFVQRPQSGRQTVLQLAIDGVFGSFSNFVPSAPSRVAHPDAALFTRIADPHSSICAGRPGEILVQAQAKRVAGFAICAASGVRDIDAKRSRWLEVELAAKAGCEQRVGAGVATQVVVDGRCQRPNPGPPLKLSADRRAYRVRFATALVGKVGDFGERPQCQVIAQCKYILTAGQEPPFVLAAICSEAPYGKLRRRTREFALGVQSLDGGWEHSPAGVRYIACR